MMPTYYEVLGVSPDAEPEVIEAAYKALVRKYHPDRAGENPRIRQITDAYSCLRDPAKRKQYDLSRRESAARQPPEPPKTNSPTEPSSAGHGTDARHQSSHSATSERAEPTKKCPDCGDNVPVSTSKCGLCGYWFRRDLYYARGCSVAVVAFILLLMLISIIGSEADNLGPGSADAGVRVPTVFQGTWAPEGLRCHSGNGLVVDESSAISRAGGDLVSVRPLGSNSAEFEFTMQDDSGPFTYREIWTVTDGAQVLEVVSDDQKRSTFRFRRCGSEPAAKSAATKLEPSQPQPPSSAVADNASLQSTTIPAAFVGEWNANPDACGTGLSDSSLRIEPELIHFYESTGNVKRVKIVNSRTITVDASYAGEGQQWDDSRTLVLSRSGNELTIEGFTRTRCP